MVNTALQRPEGSTGRVTPQCVNGWWLLALFDGELAQLFISYTNEDFDEFVAED